MEREVLLAQGDPFFVPAYVGNKGCRRIRADHRRMDWEGVAELIATSYCLVAPRRLAARSRAAGVARYHAEDPSVMRA